MKKVVYNARYGGFSLTSVALAQMHRLGLPLKGTPIKAEHIKDKFYKAENADGYRLHRNNGAFVKDGLHYSHYELVTDYDLRSHPVMVKVVQNLGANACNYGSLLRIEEFPLDWNYEIEEFDGKEQVHFTPVGTYDGYVVHEDVEHSFMHNIGQSLNKMFSRVLKR